MLEVVEHLTDYTVISQIGNGAFGVIFSAYDKRRKINVAIKIESTQNLRTVCDHEFKILKRLHNNKNNLVGFPKIYDRYTIKNSIMENSSKEGK